MPDEIQDDPALPQDEGGSPPAVPHVLASQLAAEDAQRHARWPHTMDRIELWRAVTGSAGLPTTVIVTAAFDGLTRAGTAYSTVPATHALASLPDLDVLEALLGDPFLTVAFE